MNFLDVYTTMNYIPEGIQALDTICTYLGCINERETLKRALWGHCSRVEHPGMFPFDEQTGRIYDSLWKAAAAENYSTAERIARWILQRVCPPADDEGPESFLRKAQPTEAQAVIGKSPEWEVVGEEREATQAGRVSGELTKKRSKKTD
jgi:hypothetical protein